MNTPTVLDILLAILLGLAQPASPVPPQTGADATPVQPRPAAAPVCARRIDRAAAGSAPGSAQAVAELTAGPAAINGEVTFVFEQMQGTNRLRHRVSDAVRIAPGDRMVQTVVLSVNGVTDPEVRAILPDGTTLPCH